MPLSKANVLEVISQPRIIYMCNKRYRETCTDSCFVLYCHWTYKKEELCLGASQGYALQCGAVYVLSLWYASVCVLFTLSSGDVSRRMKRCNCHDWLSDQFNKHFIIQGEKHSKPFPLSLSRFLVPSHLCFSVSLSLPLSSAGSLVFLALSCWQAIWSEPKIKLYPGSWGCWWREEQRFQLWPCVCVCV